MKSHRHSKRIAAGILCASLLGATLAPPAARAGQKEWATVGKVLTGVVAASVLHHALLPPPPPPALSRVEIRYHSPAPVVVRERIVVRTPQRAEVRHGHSRTSRHHYRDYGHRRDSRSRGYRTPSSHSHRGYRPAPGRAPIIRHYGSSRRLMQPAVRGHVAYVQHYRNGVWVTISSHPSIW